MKRKTYNTLSCTALPIYQEERKRHPGLQRPYQEDEDQVIGRILFENENTNIENTKETITKFWHKREKRRKELP